MRTVTKIRLTCSPRNLLKKKKKNYPTSQLHRFPFILRIGCSIGFHMDNHRYRSTMSTLRHVLTALGVREHNEDCVSVLISKKQFLTGIEP